MGHFPFSIIGSKQDLLVEFSSSAAGPLLNTGFHFNVGSWPGHSILVGERRGGCDWLLSEEALLASGSSEGIFQSVAHWYPPHTTCNYLIQARRGNIVRLYFPRSVLGKSHTSPSKILPVGRRNIKNEKITRTLKMKYIFYSSI